MTYLDFGGRHFTVIGQLGERGKTWLLRTEDGTILVAKYAEWHEIKLYQTLKKHPHPNIVKVVDILPGQKECLILQEYYPSVTLAERLAQDGQLSAAETKRIAACICRAMQHYGRYHIVHRDLKPENILLGLDSGVKVTDFDISRLWREDRMRDTRILGTAGYAAPEQFGFQQTDIKADIYSLGVLMNEMLTGKLPTEQRYAGNVQMAGLIDRCIAISPMERCELGEILDILDPGAVPRMTPRRFLRHIPGFRTGNTFHMSLAGIYYGYMLMVYLIFIIGGISPLKVIPGFLIMTLGVGYTVGNYGIAARRLRCTGGLRRVLLLTVFAILILTELYFAGIFME